MLLSCFWQICPPLSVQLILSVFLNNRFDTFIPELRELVRSIYALTIDFHNPETKDKTTVYTIKINIDQQPTQPINRSLGGQVTLKGVDLTPAPWRAGK